MRHKRTRRPSGAQLAAIGKIDAECRRLGARCCKRPDGISDRTWFKCYELGYIETADRDGDTPLVRVGSHGNVWLSSVPKVSTVRVPAAFLDDHESRDCEPYCDPVKRSGRYVWLRLDDPGLEELLDDARHYADPTWALDPCYFGLKRSAVATVKAIEAAQVKS
jgi:hypothetical protein